MKTCVRYVGSFSGKKRPCGKQATKKVTTIDSSAYILMNRSGDFVCDEHAREMQEEYSRHKLIIDIVDGRC